jgi:hypothetical protein
LAQFARACQLLLQRRDRVLELVDALVDCSSACGERPRGSAGGHTPPADTAPLPWLQAGRGAAGCIA